MATQHPKFGSAVAVYRKRPIEGDKGTFAMLYITLMGLGLGFFGAIISMWNRDFDGLAKSTLAMLIGGAVGAVALWAFVQRERVRVVLFERGLVYRHYYGRDEDIAYSEFHSVEFRKQGRTEHVIAELRAGGELCLTNFADARALARELHLAVFPRPDE